jgi:Na+/melibiose symporter-like transporter
MGAALTWTGFQANVTQTPETVERLRIMVGVLPALLMGCSGLLVLGFRVNARRHREIVAELRGRAAESA